MINFEARCTSLKYGKLYDHGGNLLLLIMGLSDLDSGGCLIINYNVPAILLYKYINSYRYIL
jgi:hypothetical protein